MALLATAKVAFLHFLLPYSNCQPRALLLRTRDDSRASYLLNFLIYEKLRLLFLFDFEFSLPYNTQSLGIFWQKQTRQNL
jgi:hypothetical protein